VDEIASWSRQERPELESRLRMLIGHLLKWDYHPEQRRKTWWATMRGHQRTAQTLILPNPSLKPRLTQVITDACTSAKDLVVGETPLDDGDLPENCPYTFEQL